MSGRRFALFAALALFVMFVAANLIANSWLRSWRLDLTENHVYSLSQGTKETLNALTEPVQLTLYYSRDAASVSPQLQAYGARVREMLQSFEAASHGRVRFTEVNVKPFSPEEDAATGAGIEGRALYEGGDPLYFGLVGANSINDTQTIPFFDPQREPFLEYEITRLIYGLENPELKHVALITALPIDPAAAGAAQFGAPAQSAFATELGRFAHVEKLAPDFSEIPADADVIAIIHPPPLTAAQTFAIDQFVMRKGRAFIALDPASLMSAHSSGNPYDPNPSSAPTHSTLEPLLSRWGVALSQDVVLDLDGALPINTQDENGQAAQAPQPLLFRVPPPQLDQNDLMTAWLSQGLTFAAPGALNVSERPGITATPLARTSAHTMHMPSEEALTLPPPYQILREWPLTGGHIETVALRLSGRLPTAFPNGPPEGATPEAGAPPRLTQSAGTAQVVIVADSDFLADEFYVVNNQPIADNGSFALNAIDVLTGSDALVSLRSRAPAARSMDLLDRMESDARLRIEQRQQELQAQFQQTQARLQQLQSQGHGSGFFSGNLGAELTPEEAREVETLRTQALAARAGLRNVQRDLRSDINHLEALVVFLDMWLAPLLVAGAGLFLFWRRQRRGRARAQR